MLRAILAPPSNVCLEHVSTVQERHLAILLHPHLISRMGRDHRQGRDVQTELARLGELSKTDAEGEEVIASNRCGQVRERLAHIVDTGALDAENVTVVCAAGSDEVLDALSTVAGKLLEERLRLGLYDVSDGSEVRRNDSAYLGKRSHVCCMKRLVSVLPARYLMLPKKMWRSVKTRV